MPLQNVISTVTGAVNTLFSKTNSGGGGDANNTSVNLNQFLDGKSYPSNRQGKSGLKQLLKGDPFSFVVNLYNSKQILPFYYYQEPKLSYDEQRFTNTPEVHKLVGSIDKILKVFTTQDNRQQLINNIQDPLILGFDMSFGQNMPLLGYDPVQAKSKVIPADLVKATSAANSALYTSLNPVGPAIPPPPPPVVVPFKTTSSTDPNDPLMNFIKKYGFIYPEIALTEQYLNDFRSNIEQLFKPSTPTANPDTDLTGSKFHYINDISNLKVLDDMFLSPTLFENNILQGKSYIELKLNEDATMFTNNLAFLYRNLCYNYSLGKRLIPENLLRFDMQIKFAEMRNYTSSVASFIKNNNNDNGQPPADLFVDNLRSKTTCMIYELKDCFFIFDDTILPSNIQQAGFGSISRNMAGLSLKIGFRQVERSIFPFLRYYDSLYNNPSLDSSNVSEGSSDSVEMRGAIWDANIGYNASGVQVTQTHFSQKKFADLKGVIMEKKIVPYISESNFEVLKDNVIRSKQKVTAPNTINDFINNKLSGVTVAGINLGNEAKVLSSQVKNAGKDIAREGIKKIKGAVDGVRNSLVTSLDNKISAITGFGLPRPANVYGYRYSRDAEGDILLDSNGNQVAVKLTDNSLRGVVDKVVDSIVNGINPGDNPGLHHPGIENYNINEDRPTTLNYNYNSNTNSTITTNHSVFQTTTIQGQIVPRLNPDDYAKSIGENSDREITPNYVNGVIVSAAKHNLFTDSSFNPRVVPNEDLQITPNYNNGVIVSAAKHSLFTDNNFIKRVEPNEDLQNTPNYNNGVIVSAAKHNLFTDNNFVERIEPNEDLEITPNYVNGVIVSANKHNLFTDSSFNPRVEPNEDLQITPNYVNGVIVSANKHNLFTDNNFVGRVEPNEDLQVTPNYNNGVIVNAAKHDLFTDNNFVKRVEPNEDLQNTPNYNNGVIKPIQNLYTDSTFKPREIPNENVNVNGNYNSVSKPEDINLYTKQTPITKQTLTNINDTKTPIIKGQPLGSINTTPAPPVNTSTNIEADLGSINIDKFKQQNIDINNNIYD